MLTLLGRNIDDDYGESFLYKLRQYSVMICLESK